MLQQQQHKKTPGNIGQDRSPSRVYPTFTVGFWHAKDKISHQPDHDAKMVVMVWLKQKKGGMIRVAGYGGCEERVGWWLVNSFCSQLDSRFARSFYCGWQVRSRDLNSISFFSLPSWGVSCIQLAVYLWCHPDIRTWYQVKEQEEHQRHGWDG